MPAAGRGPAAGPRPSRGSQDEDPARRRDPPGAHVPEDRRAVQRELLPERLAMAGKDPAMVRRPVEEEDHDPGVRVVALLPGDAPRDLLRVAHPRDRLDRGGPLA